MSICSNPSNIEHRKSGVAITPCLRRWTKRFLFGSLAFLALAALGGACYQFAATRRLEREHPIPGRLIDIGGHRLHLHQQGKPIGWKFAHNSVLWEICRSR